MDPALASLLAFAARFGIEATITFLEQSRNAATVDDAINALKQSQAKSWEDYKKEAAAATGALTPFTGEPVPAGEEKPSTPAGSPS